MEAGAVDSIQLTSTTKEDIQISNLVGTISVAENCVNGDIVGNICSVEAGAVESIKPTSTTKEDIRIPNLIDTIFVGENCVNGDIVCKTFNMEAGTVETIQLTSTTKKDIKIQHLVDTISVAENCVNGDIVCKTCSTSEAVNFIQSTSPTQEDKQISNLVDAIFVGENCVNGDIVGNICSVEAGSVDSIQPTSTTKQDIKLPNLVDTIFVGENCVNDCKNIWSLLDFSKRVLVVGDIVLDKYIHGTCTRIASESWVPVFTEEKEELHLGGTGNVVKNLTAMGLLVDIVSVVGRSEDYAIELLKQAKIDTSGIIVTENVCLRRVSRYVSNQTLCFRTDNEQNWQVSENVQDMVHEKIEYLMTSRNYSEVVLSDYGQGLLSKKVVQLVVTKCRQQGIPTIVDPGKRGKYERFIGINIVKLNYKEAANFIQFPCDISVACKEICEKLQAQACIITLSNKGMAFYHHSSRNFQSVPISLRVTTADVCGAGDTVLAALTFGVCHKWSLLDTCQFANACAVNVVQTFGVTSVLMIDVIAEKVLKTRKELVNMRRLIPKHKTVVLTTGCFDLIHVGHLASLQHAKELGDILIVALNSDVSVKSYKGDSRPIFPVDQRCKMLLATKYVDCIVIFDESVPHWIVDIVDPDVFVKGEEYCNKDLKSLFPNLRKIAYTPQISGTSTSIIIEQIKHL